MVAVSVYKMGPYIRKHRNKNEPISPNSAFFAPYSWRSAQYKASSDALISRLFSTRAKGIKFSTPNRCSSLKNATRNRYMGALL